MKNVAKLMLLLSLFMGMAALQAAKTIKLLNGKQVSGEILREKTDAVYVDLGFTILNVPRSYISSIIDTEKAAPRDQSFQDGLYSVADQKSNLTLKEMVEQNGEAVVLIRTNTSLGSGFIIHPEGYIVTNDHVVAGEHDISVTVFEQGENDLSKVQFENVRIVATNSSQDLALLKIETDDNKKFKFVPLGESDSLKSGQQVFAIGSPLGLERSVSEGIISLKNRLINERIYIQQTAEISPGNSGGPLFNLDGEVIGVNNMKVVAAGAEGLGFAIPSNVLKVFLRNRDTYAFDPQNPNSGFRYNAPPTDQGDIDD